MPTAKTRINISLSDDISNAITKLAHRDRIPRATKAARLLETALELEEDLAWDAIAKRRDAGSVRYFAHGKAWK
ncbi:MAG: hypothetical protein Q8Q41_03175 [bacterium]|nr:hypothetical protein [bacterium]